MTRMLHTVSRSAIVALLAVTPVAAFAQSDTAKDAELKQNELKMQQSGDASVSGTVDAQIESDVETDTDMTAETDKPATQEMLNEDATTGVATNEALMEDNDEDVAMRDTSDRVRGQITMQDENTVLAEDLLGATVYNNADESVGDINDLIIGLDGNVKGVVIGVGGFLGLGEKQVAVEMAALNVIENDGSPRLVTSATKDDLEAAPEFVSVEDQADAERMNDIQPANDSMGGVTKPVE